MAEILIADEKIAGTARAAVGRVLPRTKIESISIDARRLSPDVENTVVFSAGRWAKLNGEQILKIQKLIVEDLGRKGDEGVPYLRYLTAYEIKQMAS